MRPTGPKIPDIQIAWMKEHGFSRGQRGRKRAADPGDDELPFILLEKRIARSTRCAGGRAQSAQRPVLDRSLRGRFASSDDGARSGRAGHARLAKRAAVSARVVELGDALSPDAELLGQRAG